MRLTNLYSVKSAPWIVVVAVLGLALALGLRQRLHGWECLPALAFGAFGLYACLGCGRRCDAMPALERWSWRLLALGAAAWLAARASSLPVPFPLPGEILTQVGAWAYLAVPPAVLVALLFRALNRPAAGQLRRGVEAATDCGIVLALCWYFVLRPIGGGALLDGNAQYVGLIYPLLDIGITFWAILLYHSRFEEETPAASHLLALAALLLALSDLLSFWALTRLLVHGTVYLGWNDATWGLGFLAAGLSARARKRDLAAGSASWHASPEAVERGVRASAIAAKRVVIPSLMSLGTAVLVLWHSYDRGHRLQSDVCLVAFCLISTMLLRQLLVLAENNQLARQLDQSNRSLEDKVHQRTRQLADLHEIARAANASLEVEHVLEEILRRTADLLHADGAAVWFVERTPEGAEHLELSRSLGFDGPGEEDLLRAIDERWARGLAEQLQERRSVPLPLVHGNGGACAQLMCAALQWQGRALGLLGAVRRRGQLGDTERSLLEAVALEVGVAVQNARLYDSAVHAADHDFVTGLFNHRAMMHHLSREFKRAHRAAQSLAVLIMDLDNFKLFNDTHGHLVGDQVLKCVADVLEEVCRLTDLVGRHGGDEFIALCPNTDVAGARTLASRIQERLAESAPITADGRRLPLAISCGLAVYPDTATSQHELLAMADMNLYEAKTGGEPIVGGDEQTEESPRSVGGFSTLDALVTAVDKRDRYTRKHSEDVTEYSLMIAQELGLSSDTRRTLRLAGLLHDLGKIAIPDQILRKPGKLTQEEFEVMKQHPMLGWMIVSAIPNLSETLPAIRHHHERYDGMGYPDGLAGESIPFLGRLMAVADAFSAMTTDRPYRKGMPVSEASAELRRGRGTQWDPVLVDAFLRALDAGAEEGRREAMAAVA